VRIGAAARGRLLKRLAGADLPDVAVASRSAAHE